jgi:hypothetical protein
VSSGVAVQLLRLLKESFGVGFRLLEMVRWTLGVETGDALAVLEGNADTLRDMEPSSET